MHANSIIKHSIFFENTIIKHPTRVFCLNHYFAEHFSKRIRNRLIPTNCIAPRAWSSKSGFGDIRLIYFPKFTCIFDFLVQCMHCSFFLRFFFKLNPCKMHLTHIAKSWKIFPKTGRSLRGFLGKIFQTFFKISDFGSWVRSFSGKFFQLHFVSAFSGKKFVLIIWVRLERVSDHFWVI